MEYTNLGRNGVKVSRLCLGTMMFGNPTTEADSIDIINKAYDDGVNFIDTANVYNNGESERITGKAIKDKRDKVVIVTKVCGPRGDGINDGGVSRYHIMNEVENSLKRLGTDYIDIYMLHRAVYDCPIEETLRALDDLVAQGKIRYPGCSNFYGHQLTEALWVADKRGYAPVTVVQAALQHRQPGSRGRPLPRLREVRCWHDDLQPARPRCARWQVSRRAGSARGFPCGS